MSELPAVELFGAFDSRCSRCPHAGTYSMAVLCTNCRHEGVGLFSMGHEAGEHRCPNCGCRTLYPDRRES